MNSNLLQPISISKGIVQKRSSQHDDDHHHDDGNKVTPSADTCLGPYDVICGRHKSAFNNVGNRRMRATISMYIDRFVASRNRREKASYITAVLDIFEVSGGRFLKWCNQTHCFVSLDQKKAYDKIGHAFRDMVAASRSKQTRKARRSMSLPHEHAMAAAVAYEKAFPITTSTPEGMSIDICDMQDAWSLPSDGTLKAMHGSNACRQVSDTTSIMPQDMDDDDDDDEESKDNDELLLSVLEMCDWQDP
jgi:hypothetical protein